MMKNYLAASSLTREEFLENRVDLTSSDQGTKSDAKDISKIENLLDLTPGILSENEFYLEKTECECGRTLKFSDFVFTALVEQWHDPSFIAHTLVGRKYFLNEARPIRCSDCGARPASDARVQSRAPGSHYDTGVYGCCLKVVY